MLVVHVHIHVKPESVAAFCEATRHNAKQSLREPGVVRFDFIQRQDDPTRFVLIEVYRSESDPARHKETSHYQAWRDAVEPMMAEPRRSEKYLDLYPPAEGWETVEP